MAHFAYSSQMSSNTTNSDHHVPNVIKDTDGTRHSFNFHNIYDLLYIVIGGLLLFCLFCCIILLFIKYKKAPNKPKQDPSSKPKHYTHREMKLDDLEANAKDRSTPMNRIDTFDRIMYDRQTTVTLNPVHSPIANQAPLALNDLNIFNHNTNNHKARSVHQQSPRDIHQQSPRSIRTSSPRNMYHPNNVSPRIIKPYHSIHPQSEHMNVRDLKVAIPTQEHSRAVTLSNNVQRSNHRPQMHIYHHQSHVNVQSNKKYVHESRLNHGYNTKHVQDYSGTHYNNNNNNGYNVDEKKDCAYTESISTVNTKYRQNRETNVKKDIQGTVSPRGTYAVVDTLTNIVNAATPNAKQTTHVLTLNKLNIDIAHSIGGSAAGSSVIELNREPSFQSAQQSFNMEPSHSRRETPTTPQPEAVHKAYVSKDMV